MISRRQRALNLYARLVQKPLLAIVQPQPLARRVFSLNAVLGYKTPADLALTPLTLRHDGETVPATICQSGPAPTGGTLLYLHGGAFVIGNLRGYRHLVAALGKAAGQRAIYVDYRLAPEHPFPAALDDAMTAYRALLADPAAGPITVAGDSAGGNLVFALLHRILTEKLPKPAAIAALSPIVDLRLINPSLQANRRRDPLVPTRWGARGVSDYLQGQDPENPDASPILGRFDGAPPTLIHVDKTEVLYDDSRLMAAHLRRAGVAVTLTETEGLPHVHHLNVGRTPEADRAVTAVGAFLAEMSHTT